MTHLISLVPTLGPILVKKGEKEQKQGNEFQIILFQGCTI